LTLEEAMKNISEAAALCLQDETPRPAATFVGVRDLEIVA
jgi:predicted RNase H-like HicB family nuclease